MPISTSRGPREAKLFRNNRSQAVRIPAEFELPGDRVLISRDGHRLIMGGIRLTYHPTTGSPPADRPATKPTEEMVLTSSMMAAGVKAFWTCTRGPGDLDTAESAIYSIFMAMMKASAKYHIQDISDPV